MICSTFANYWKLVLMKRVVLAFLIAPATALLLAAVADGIGYVLGSSLKLSGLGLVLTAVYAYPTAVILGIPTFLVFRHRGWFRWWQFVLGGMVIGCIPPLLVLVGIFGMPFAEFLLSADGAVFLGLGAAIGAVSVLVFWLLAYPFNMSTNPALNTDAARPQRAG